MSKELIRLSDCFMKFDDDVILDHINLYINDKGIPHAARSLRVRQNHDAPYHRRLSEADLRRRVF